MGETKIEWCDFVFNAWVGCQKVGPPCDNCYAEGWAKRSGQVQWGVDPKAVRSTNPGYCFMAAGWRRCGVTKGGLIILERPAISSDSTPS